MNLYNHHYKRLIYNGELLDEVLLKVNREKIKYFDDRTEKIRSWEHLLDFEFQGQINFLVAQNKVYRGRVECSLKEINQLIELISREINN
jgi:hypothetical protein